MNGASTLGKKMESKTPDSKIFVWTVNGNNYAIYRGLTITAATTSSCDSNGQVRNVGIQLTHFPK